MKTADEKGGKTRAGKGAGKSDRANSKAPPKGQQWPRGDWAARMCKMRNAESATKETEKEGANKRDKNNVGRSEKK